MENVSLKYPFLKGPTLFGDPTEDWLDEVPIGWQEIFLKACDRILQEMDKYNEPYSKLKIEEIKEKYGELRVYVHFSPMNKECSKSIQTILHDLMNESGTTCFECGAPAKYLTKGWILPYCEKCAIEQNTEWNERHKTSFSFDEVYTLI